MIPEADETPSSETCTCEGASSGRKKQEERKQDACDDADM
jgi:hypothetical protein